MSVNDGGIGEASRTREDGDDERPLKKARFAWQVKGKHHLRREERSELPELQESDSDAEEAPAASPVHRLTQQNSGGGRGGVRSCTEWEERLEMWERDLSNEDLPTLVSRRVNRREDYLLEMWQARQLAKCAVDNTINRVLDTWTATARARTDTDDSSSVADVSDAPAHSIQVENEGILMAISAHGLTTPHQHPIHFQAPVRVEQECCYHKDLEIVQLCSPCHLPHEGSFIPDLDQLKSSRPVDPTPVPDRIDSESPHWSSESPQRGYMSPQRGYESPRRVNESLQRGYESPQMGYMSPQRGYESPQRDYESPQRSHKSAQMSYKSPQRSCESPQRDYKFQQWDYESAQRNYMSAQRGCESPRTEAKFPTTDQMEADEHFNFMDAAVSFAIQHKGLTSLASGNG